MAKCNLILFCVILTAWKAAAGRCPETCKQFGDSCYKYIETPANFESARSKCSDNNGYLAEVNSAAENDFLAGLTASGKYSWIGLEDKKSDGVFTYAKSNTAPDYTNWASGEPNNVDPVAEDCVEMYNSGKWNDQNCGDVSNYFCERKACKEGWSYFEGNCYMCGNSKVDYAAAEKKCDDEGGFLATIKSAEENTFIDTLRANAGINEPIYIGLTDRENEGTFVWTHNKEAPTYTNWYQGEPNDAEGEDCTEMWGGGVWNDWGCEKTRPYCCKQKF